ncbi:DUF2514 domain-containing protein [Ramlibacter sp. H39-3-26]|uniref:DUF2514 domain-containing protein n=1 Tax=Curvibacter soli TaxID=3031331 RepID=UPI0023D9CCFB|nr:DUF2514 domain-containing protein [Ramlibacter sp. H39-3-26]MDF1486716.1 DUF2514 domain-containing protein [Ramlibacter sp. H39-3-26]
MSLRVIAAVVLTLAVVLGVRAWNVHLIALGDAQGAERVRGEWHLAETKRSAELMQAEAEAGRRRALAETLAREDEQAKQIQAERIAREQAQREGALRAAVGRADARNRSLFDTIAELNAQLAHGGNDMPGTIKIADTSTIVDAARTARELLASCSSRYAAVAAEADRLGNQVSGLQDFVRTVVPNAQEPISHDL